MKASIQWTRSLVVLYVFLLGWGAIGKAPPTQDLQAQVGIDFNQGDSSGSLNLTASYRMFHDVGGIIPLEQNALFLALNGFFWLRPNLSTRFSLGLGFPLLSPENGMGLSEQALYFYEVELGLRITLLKFSSAALMLGPAVDASEGHSGSMFLPEGENAYLQTTLGLDFEMVFALGLEYLLYLRLKVPILAYNAIPGDTLTWSFYPRQAALEAGFLFHKGPTFSLSKAARNVYFGPYYRFEVRLLNITSPNLIVSHTFGVTYYVKPPF